MESSLSTPYHRRRLSGVNGFSSKNAYDDVFTSPPTLGARKVKSRVLEDYKEIFASSRASSIPVLDISPPAGVDVDSVSDYRNSELDYSNIFGGLRDNDAGGVCYEQVIANAAGTNRETTKTSRKIRTPSAPESPIHGSDCLKASNESKVLSSDEPVQSVDDKKHFSMSYHKTNTGSKDGTNGTTHVAQFLPVRGFTRFIDETTPQKIEADKSKSSVVSDVLHKVDVNEAILENRNTTKGMSHLTNKDAFRRDSKSRSNSGWDGSYSYDKLFNSHENNLKSHPTENRPPSGIPYKIDSSGNSKRLWASKNDASEHVAGKSSSCIPGEELDVNSAAAASAAVLKDAIQKAQESIRLAKELMERKREGLRRPSSHNSRNNVKVKDKMENVIAYEGNRLKDTNAKDISGSVDFVSQLFSGMRKKSAIRSGLSPDFKQKERSFIKENVVDDENAKSLGMAEESELQSLEKKREVIPSIESMDKVESNVMEQQQVYNEKTDEKAQKLVYVERKLNAVKGDDQTDLNENKVEPVCIVSEPKKVENFRVLQEDEFVEAIHTHIHINKDGEKSSKDSQQEKEDATESESNNDLRVNIVPETEDIENKQDISQQDHIAKTTKDIEKDGSDYGVEKNGDDERISIDIHDGEGSEHIFENFGNEDLSGRFEKAEFICIETEEIEVLQVAHHGSDVYDHVHDKNETEKAFKYNINHVHLETGQEVDDHSTATKDFYDFNVDEAEAVKLAYNPREKEHLSTGNLAPDLADVIDTINNEKVVSEILLSKDSSPKFGSTFTDHGGIESTRKGGVRKDRMPSDEEAGKSTLGYVNDNLQHDAHFEISEGPKAKEKTSEVEVEIKIRKDTTKNVEGVDKIINIKEKGMEMNEEIQARQGKEIHDVSSSKNFDMEKEAKRTVSVVKEKEGLIKNNEEMKRDHEREKEKIAVERAIREVRERAFAEARERAERAAVERATAEVRQRVMAEARDKFDKDTAATKLSAEKASVQAKLRSERAAVERATAEARERALEKALSQKSRAQTERSTSQNHAGPSRDNSTKKSSSSDLETNCENNTDSVQRNKANVEKHERIMERTAKALAEKNMRDLLAQKELAEKNRLAEALDADIKRWSNGKEGNLRALLSTLQYILGPGSGWQPISLTEIITTNAVKKAYRKATLYVHPDKLQQRGANIQQKYICEKVFDLLKAAWNKFNKEER
ncbi:hypothetical protein ACET3Z_015673 [Daucus carota]